MKAAILSFALALILALAGCGNPTTATTPAPPNSAQTQTHNVNKTLADSINAAVKTAISMRDQGKLSATVTKQIEDWAVSATLVSDKIEMEIASADPWPTQKQKILVLLAGFQIPNPGPIEATVQAALATIRTVAMQLQSQVAQ